MAQRSKVTEKEKYSQARSLLEESLLRVEKALIENQSLSTTERIERAYNVIFESQTQAYREVLLGCLLTRITDRSKNIRHPYTALSDNAFSGRSLDERVVNPFLQEKSIPLGDEAKQQVEKYFAHGYDVNFVDIQEWLINTLVIVGVKGRKHFQERIVYHLSKDQVPKILKLAWNEEMGKLIAA